MDLSITHIVGWVAQDLTLLACRGQGGTGMGHEKLSFSTLSLYINRIQQPSPSPSPFPDLLPSDPLLTPFPLTLPSLPSPFALPYLTLSPCPLTPCLWDLLLCLSSLSLLVWFGLKISK